MFDARVVTRRNELRAEPLRIAVQRPELHEIIACDAWVRRAARDVVARKAFDDVRPKRLLEIQHIVRDAQRRGTAPRIVKVVGAAA